MKKCSSPVMFLLFLIISALPGPGKAQNIDGDTIFVNTNVEAQIIFPSEVDDARLNPINTHKEIEFPVTGNSILLHSVIENSKQATLVVKEGGRDHRFIIIYKKDINQYDSKEYNYNYKTLKLLKKHVEETAGRNAKATVVAVEKKPQPKQDKNESNEEKPVDNTRDYNTLIQRANEAFNKGKFDEAIPIYEKAGLLKPGDDYAGRKIDQARVEINNIAKQEQLENERKYDSLKNQGKIYLSERKYSKARESFVQAKFIMPGDGYSIRQIEIIDKLIDADNKEKERKNQVTQFNTYMTEGDKAFDEKKLEVAETSYRNALTINPYDKKALARLQDIDKLKKKIALEDEVEIKYSDAIRVADKLLNELDYSNAITEYNNALRIFARAYPRDKIKEITKILADQEKEKKRLLDDLRTEENERNRLKALQKAIDSKYEVAIAKGAAELNKNNYPGAKNFYKQAAALKPLETLHLAPLDLIEIKLDQIAYDKQKREDSTRQARELDKNYNLALAQAKSYQLKNELPQAKLAYEAAADLKPLKEESKKQLANIINKLAEIEREKKLNDQYDSLAGAADGLMILKDYDLAIENYEAALKIKPKALYPASQIKYIKTEIRIKADKDAAKKKHDEEIRFFNLKRSGDSAVAAKNWAGAVKAFTEALVIHPRDNYIEERLKRVQIQYDLQLLAEKKAMMEKQALEEKERLEREKKKKKRRRN